MVKEQVFVLLILFSVLLVSTVASEERELDKQGIPEMGEKFVFTTENKTQQVEEDKKLKKKMTKLTEKVANLFFNAYSKYLYHAFPKDELMPVKCNGIDSFGGISVTIVDSLDTLAVIGDYNEFNTASKKTAKQPFYFHLCGVSQKLWKQKESTFVKN